LRRRNKLNVSVSSINSTPRNQDLNQSTDSFDFHNNSFRLPEGD